MVMMADRSVSPVNLAASATTRSLSSSLGLSFREIPSDFRAAYAVIAFFILEGALEVIFAMNIQFARLLEDIKACSFCRMDDLVIARFHLALQHFATNDGISSDSLLDEFMGGLGLALTFGSLGGLFSEVIEVIKKVLQ